MAKPKLAIFDLKDVGPRVHAFREEKKKCNYQQASEELMLAALDVAIQLLRKEVMEIHIQGEDEYIIEGLLRASDYIQNYMDNNYETPALLMAKNIFYVSGCLQAVLENRHKNIKESGDSVSLIIIYGMELGQMTAYGELLINGLWDQVSENMYKVYGPHKAKGGGHNRKWAEIAKPYITQNPTASRTAITKMILSDHPDGDHATVMRALTPLFEKSGSA